MTALAPITVLGAGSWGTALAIQLARSGREVVLWGRKPEHMMALAEARENTLYLPGCTFPDSLHPVADLADALARGEEILLVVPSHALRELLLEMQQTGHAVKRLAFATKGFEIGSGKLSHEVIADVFGAIPSVAISGPTFATEVGKGLPTAITIAGDAALADVFADALHGPRFRSYTSRDIIGVEIGGSVKNVIAIGAGLSDGLGFGANARIALITRSLAEITRLGVALGAQAETFMGLSGMGDLVLTCTDNQSRNRRFGLALGAGKSADDARREIFQVVEGVSAAKETAALAARLDVDMPIASIINAVLQSKMLPSEAVSALFERERKPESH